MLVVLHIEVNKFPAAKSKDLCAPNGRMDRPFRPGVHGCVCLCERLRFTYERASVCRRSSTFFWVLVCVCVFCPRGESIIIARAKEDKSSHAKSPCTRSHTHTRNIKSVHLMKIPNWSAVVVLRVVRIVERKTTTAVCNARRICNFNSICLANA